MSRGLELKLIIFLLRIVSLLRFSRWQWLAYLLDCYHHNSMCFCRCCWIIVVLNGHTSVIVRGTVINVCILLKEDKTDESIWKQEFALKTTILKKIIKHRNFRCFSVHHNTLHYQISPSWVFSWSTNFLKNNIILQRTLILIAIFIFELLTK